MSLIHHAIHNGLLMLLEYKDMPESDDSHYHEMLDRIRGSLEEPLGSRLKYAFIRFTKARADWDGRVMIQWEKL